MASSIEFLNSKIEILERRIEGLGIENQTLKDYIKLLEADDPRKSKKKKVLNEDHWINEQMSAENQMTKESFEQLIKFYKTEFNKIYSRWEIRILKTIIGLSFYNCAADWLNGRSIVNNDLSVLAGVSIDSIIKYRKALTDSFVIEDDALSKFMDKYKPNQERVAELFEAPNKVRGILVYEPKGTRAPGNYRLRFSETLLYVDYSFLSLYN